MACDQAINHVQPKQELKEEKIVIKTEVKLPEKKFEVTDVNKDGKTDLKDATAVVSGIFKKRRK